MNITCTGDICLGFEYPQLLLVGVLVVAVSLVATKKLNRVWRRIYTIKHPLTDTIGEVTSSTRVEKFYLLLILLVFLAAASPYISTKKVVEFEEEAVGRLEVNARPTAILIIDVSGSMGGEKIEIAKDALKAFMEEAKDVFDIGLIAFSDKVVATVPPTSDLPKLYNTIDKLVAGGGTMYSYPLKVASNWAKPYRAFNVTVVVVFATDGIPADRGVYDIVVEELAKLGVTIHSIIIGSLSGGYGVLKNTVSGPTGGNVYEVDDINKLVDLYKKLAHKLKQDVEVRADIVLRKEIWVKNWLSKYLLLVVLSLLLLRYLSRVKKNPLSL